MGVELWAFGFVEDIHVSSNTCKDVQACANTGSVSDEKGKNVQAHGSLSKGFAGSLLDAGPPESEVRARMQPLLEQVTQLSRLTAHSRARQIVFLPRLLLLQLRLLWLARGYGMKAP